MSPRVRQSPIPPDTCHLARAIDAIGDRWTLLILRSALFGISRFDDFQDELDVSRSILANRLKKLTGIGLLEKRSYRESGSRQRSEYVLTEAGRALQPTLMALTQWSDDWLVPDKTPPLGLRDARTRLPVKAGFLDAEGREVAAENVRVALRR